MDLASDEKHVVNSSHLSYEPSSSAKVATLDEAHADQNLMHAESMTSTSAIAAVPICNIIDTEHCSMENFGSTGGQRSPSNGELKTNHNVINELDMRMLIMRERFKKLEELDDGEPNADQSPGDVVFELSLFVEQFNRR